MLSTSMICTKHGKDKKKIVNKNGKKAIRCMICYKEYVRRKTDKRAKIKEVLAIERGCRCLDCNNTFEPKLLDFHHRDPNQKDFAISDFFRFAAGGVSRKELIEEEAEKCDMLCPVCHRRRHYANIPAPRRPKDKTRLKYKAMLVDAFGGACWSCGDELECFNFDFHHLVFLIFLKAGHNCSERNQNLYVDYLLLNAQPYKPMKNFHVLNMKVVAQV